MRPVGFGLVIGVLLGATSGTALAQNSDWKAMEFSDLTRPGSMSWIAGEIWPDVAARENDYLQKVLKRSLPAGGNSVRVLTASVNSAGTSYLVSIVLSLDCEAGSNHNAALAEPSICPIRISQNVQGRWETLLTDRACFADPQDATAAAANRFDDAQVQFDEKRRVLNVRANIGGIWLATCTRSFPIP
ncbi:MAG: hypothetical protein O9314_02720 [Microcystis sp. LE19-4.1E]|nr:hypothetical protein [Microcystis sp. LE19-4.1E]